MYGECSVRMKYLQRMHNVSFLSAAYLSRIRGESKMALFTSFNTNDSHACHAIMLKLFFYYRGDRG